ncbi:trans-Golgi network integral membrane protein TGN38-like isoform X2 [Ceratina calcarata]|uniref:Trans-Golgi network integral membrane protein TGN38-like isoform X2 n=1 Tax=Ceratina calcarata TaxID=156304 RepID=A0AAJ7J175_9HYME|nr:trans-Golgi network integral membrane protein TGN38-like isoform X2 [Ceratina calcarata]
MGEHVIRSFYGLGIFVFFLYFMKVSSAPSASTPNIIDMMTDDKELSSCNVPNFLYNNNVTRDCHNVTYPDDKSVEDIPKKTFLCMTFYDTIYKACQTNQLRNPVFNDVTTFYTYIQNFIPKKNEEDQTKFCENIRGITFTYKKLKPLSLFNLNNSHVCYSACFSVTETFIQLCAILPWSKSIDDNIIETSKIEQKKVQTDGSLDESKKLVTDGEKKVTEQKLINKNEAQKNKSANVKNTETAQETPPVSNKSTVEKSANVSIKQTTNNADTPPVDKQVQEVQKLDTVNVDDTEKVSVNKEKPDDPKKVDDINGNVDKTKIEETEDVKTSTISENTEDRENSANQDDWADGDPNEGLDQASVTEADSEQGVPEPSEQRDFTSRYHSIRTDDESHFFTYFTIVSLLSVAAYVGYHNKQKILAIVLEGRRSRNNRGRRRPSTANYRKLDCTLEEAVTSQCNANVTHVIY